MFHRAARGTAARCDGVLRARAGIHAVSSGDLSTLTRLSIPVDRGSPPLFGDRLDGYLAPVLVLEPMEYSRPRSVMWWRNSFEHAPVSARTSIRSRAPAGRWSGAASTVATRSVLFHAAAFPGRRSQHQRLAGAVLAVVDEGAHRGEPEPTLERRFGAFLVRVRGDQRGVDVDDHLTPTAATGPAEQRPDPPPHRPGVVRSRATAHGSLVGVPSSRLRPATWPERRTQNRMRGRQ